MIEHECLYLGCLASCSLLKFIFRDLVMSFCRLSKTLAEWLRFASVSSVSADRRYNSVTLPKSYTVGMPYVLGWVLCCGGRNEYNESTRRLTEHYRNESNRNQSVIESAKQHTVCVRKLKTNLTVVQVQVLCFSAGVMPGTVLPQTCFSSSAQFIDELAGFFSNLQ